MDLRQLQCFVAVADSLHFGRAAQKLGMLPASLGRHLRLLEEEVGAPLVARTTRSVSLTPLGTDLLEEARDIVARAAQFEQRARARNEHSAPVLRVGAIDSAATGLIPQLLSRFHENYPQVEVRLLEQKTVRLVPRLLSGRLDVAFVRPPEHQDPRLVFRHLLYESAVVVVPDSHRLAEAASVRVEDLAEEPLIVPDRYSRPHSHDLTIKLFLGVGLTARIAQIAEEKQTIVSLVASGIGLAIVPRWTSRLAIAGVKFIPLEVATGPVQNRLQLAAAWVRGTRDPLREALLDTLKANIEAIAETA